jgi:hypothetical protein
LKQRLKNLVDPVNIPIVGIPISVSRAKTADNHKKEMLKLSEDADSDHLKKSFLMMENGMQRRKVWYTTGAITKTILLLFPITYVPGAGQIVGQAAQSIAQPLVAETAENSVKIDQEASAVAEANYKYAATRAFMIYLGRPRNDEDIYHSWEEARLAIKAIYGAKPDDDLTKQKPNDHTLKKLKEMVSSDKGFNLDELKVSLLVVMWWFFECWDEQYYDRFRIKKWKMQESERHHVQDERMVLMMINPLDPKVQMLSEFSTPEILKVLADKGPYGYGNHPKFAPLLGSKDRDPLARKGFVAAMKSFIVKFLKKQNIWGYFDDSGALCAVIFYEKAEGKRIHLGDAYGKDNLVSSKVKADKKLQHQLLVQEDEIVAANMPDASGILHLFSATDTPAGRKGLMILIKSAAEYTSTMSFVCEYTNQKKRIELLKDCKFTVKATTDNITSMVLKPPQRKRDDYAVSEKTFDRLSRAGITY